MAFPDPATGYGADVRSRLEVAQGVTLGDYLAASAERRRIRAGFARLFRVLVMNYTVPQDLVGLPACAVRAGFDDLGIPVAIQLSGAPWQEARVIGAATAFFAATPAVQSHWPG